MIVYLSKRNEYVILSEAAVRRRSRRIRSLCCIFKGKRILRLAALAQDDTLFYVVTNHINNHLPFQKEVHHVRP